MVLTVIEPRFTFTATLPATDKSSVAIVPVVPVMVRSSVATLPATESSSASTVPLPLNVSSAAFGALPVFTAAPNDELGFAAEVLKLLEPCRLPDTFTLTLP